MPATYEPIATTTLGSAAATITFSSIPSTYTDLRLVIVPLGTLNSYDVWLRLNNDSGTNYSHTYLVGNGSAASSGQTTAADKMNLSVVSGSSVNTTIPILIQTDIFSYAGSTNKTVLSSNSSDKNGTGNSQRVVFLWRNTAAITTLTLSLEGGGTTFATGTTATLYGILKA